MRGKILAILKFNNLNEPIPLFNLSGESALPGFSLAAALKVPGLLLHKSYNSKFEPLNYGWVYRT
jgi:hypothetical protein